MKALDKATAQRMYVKYQGLDIYPLKQGKIYKVEYFDSKYYYLNVDESIEKATVESCKKVKYPTTSTHH